MSRHIARGATALVLALGLLGVPAALGQGAPRAPDGTFRNNYAHPEMASAAGFLAWQRERLANGAMLATPKGAENIPVVKTDAASLRAPSAPASITWIGHATVLVRLAGKTILIDPVFSDRPSPVTFAGPRRVVPVPIDIPELPPVDVVMITHSHYDHLDEASVRRLAALGNGGPRFLVPLGLKSWFAEFGILRVDQFDWWQETRDGGLRIVFVPAQHWSRRNGIDTNRTLWGGWVVEGEGRRLVHTGDTGYSQDFRDIGARLGPFDLAMIPIGAYAPRWYMHVMHADVADAIRIRADLRARRAIGIHWGTFAPFGDEPLDEPPQLLERERETRGLSREQFDTMAIGETRRLP